MSKKLIALALAGLFILSVVAPAKAVTVDELQAQITALLAQITTLQQQLAQAQGQTSSGVCFYTDLQQGMTSAEVSKLQTQLKLDPTVYPEGLVTGYFGPLTLKAAKAFQAKYGIITTGYVGPLTRAKLNELYCTPVVTTTTTVAPETTTTTVAPSYGTLSVVSYPVSNPQTTLYGGSTYELLAGQYKATGSDITLKKVALQIVDNDTTTFPWQVFTTISLWDGSTKLAEVIPTEANMIKNTFAHDYTVDISGFNLVIPKDTQKVLTVKGTIVANPVAAVTANNYDLTLLKGSVVYSDTAGVTYTAVSATNDITANNFLIKASQAAGKTISLATDNPLAGNVVVSSSGVTKADVLKFNVKITDINTTFSSGVIGITVDGTKVTPAMITSLELWDGGTLITSAAPGTWSATTSTISWTNFTLPVSAGVTKTFTVKAVLAQVASDYANDGSGYLQITTGPKLTGIDANSNVVTADGSTSVTGNKLYPFLSAPVFTYIGSNVTIKNSSDTVLNDIGDTSITFSVSAQGVNDIYIPTKSNASVTLGMYETLTGGTSTTTTSTTWTCNSPAVEDTTLGAGKYLYRIPSGTSANCSFSTLVTNTDGTAGYFSVALGGVKWYDSATSTADSFIPQDWGLTNIKTADFYLAK